MSLTQTLALIRVTPQQLAEKLAKLHRTQDDIQHVAFQDDVYVLVRPEFLDAILALVEQLWAELGLAVNRSKLAVWAPNHAIQVGLSSFWQERCTSSLKVLGQRLQVQLGDEGLPLILGDGDPLPQAVGQLQHLQARIQLLESAGLAPAVGHQIWLYASAGAVTHLLACS